MLIRDISIPLTLRVIIPVTLLIVELIVVNVLIRSSDTYSENNTSYRYWRKVKQNTEMQYAMIEIELLLERIKNGAMADVNPPIVIVARLMFEMGI